MQCYFKYFQMHTSARFCVDCLSRWRAKPHWKPSALIHLYSTACHTKFRQTIDKNVSSSPWPISRKFNFNKKLRQGSWYTAPAFLSLRLCRTNFSPNFQKVKLKSVISSVKLPTVAFPERNIVIARSAFLRRSDLYI